MQEYTNKNPILPFKQKNHAVRTWLFSILTIIHFPGRREIQNQGLPPKQALANVTKIPPFPRLPLRSQSRNGESRVT
jgi:hypothetical protein